MNNIKLLILGLLMPASLLAVTPITAPYILSFEDSDQAEIDEWTFNPGPLASECAEKWVIGDAVHNSGRKALYISCDGGQSNLFSFHPDVQYAYRDFKIPMGQYDITFDYLCLGENNKIFLNAGVTFVTAVEADMNAKSVYSGVPASIQNACKVKNLYDASRWKTESFSFTAKSNDVVLRLFFVWSNGNTNKDRYMPIAASIDNIQITSRNCAKPLEVKATAMNDSVIVTWEGTSEEYIFERRRHGSETWYCTTGITEKQLLLEGLNEGAWDFRVRGVCNDVEQSAYAYLNNFVVYYPERHCVDYVHLGSENIHGTIGTYADPYQMVDTIVDYGDDRRSRHTVILDPDGRDPRTGYQLPMVPEGDWASVRLGNWNTGAEAESMSFDITVDESSALLLIRYAVVLEDPNHDMKQQPRFRMEILDEYGDMIDPTCGAADFYADMTREGWHTYGSNVTWKDWTTLGLNLWDMGLAGQTITVRFTTYDCSMSGHYGYAYFTINCASAQIMGVSCGNDTIMNINAPEGFDYVWYNKYNEEVSRSLSLALSPSDTTTYRCHLSYIESPDCGFDLYGANKPRYPYADFDWTWIPSNCENKIRLHNKSHVFIQVDDYIEHTTEPCEEYQWSVGDMLSPDNNPVIKVPNAGGDIRVILSAQIANGHCEDIKDTIIHVPSIGDTTIVVDSTICHGDFYLIGDKFSDKMYYAADSGRYEVHWTSIAGCDSALVLNLNVHPTTEEYIGDTTVCAEVPLIVDDQPYRLTESGKYYRFYTNQYGCDSTVWMNVTIMDSILPIVRIQDMTDEPNSGAIYITGTGYDYLTMDGDTIPYSDSIAITGLNAGDVELVFYNTFGCNIIDSVMIAGCLVGHVYQRWDNVLSLKNADAVGDTTLYEFSDFQWYCNEQAIEGATLSYLYIEEGLKNGAQYVLEMTDARTGKRVQTCPIVAKSASEQVRVIVYPSPVRAGNKLTIKTDKPAHVTICNMLGETAVSADLVAGENQIDAPAIAGIYVVQVQTDNTIQSCQISVIE